MEVLFRNLGPIVEARVDMSKPLIIVTGPNNSGKTFLTWSVYGLLTQSRHHRESQVVNDFADRLLAAGEEGLAAADFRTTMTFPHFVQAIAQSLRPELRVDPVVLQEAGEGGPHPSLQIGKSEDALCISFDRCCDALAASDLATWLHPLFRDGVGLRKSCDFVVFHQHHGTLFVLLFELKSGHSAGAREQIASTRLLVDHLLDAIVRVRGLESIPRRYRGFVVKSSARAKKHNPRTIPLPFHPDPRMPDLGSLTVGYRFHYLDAFCGPVPLLDDAQG